jgi:CRISPR-associated protein Cas1
VSSWRVLDFTNAKVSLSTERGKLVVVSTETQNETKIPLDEISIVLTGLNTRFGGGTLHQFSKFDIVNLFTDWKYLPVGGVYPWFENHNRVAARHRAQAGLTEPRRKNAWLQIIKSKVRSQAHTLDKLGDSDGSVRLMFLSDEVRSGDPSNVEAEAARFYWSRLFRASGKQDETESWNRDQNDEDIKNTFLNYAYTVLRGHSIRAVLSAGLSPTLGVFHKNRSNFFCLCDDIIETFRPAVDYTVATLDYRKSINNSEMKAILVDSCSGKFSKSGLTVPSVMNDLAQQYGRYVENEIEKLKVPIYEV